MSSRISRVFRCCALLGIVGFTVSCSQVIPATAPSPLPTPAPTVEPAVPLAVATVAPQLPTPKVAEQDRAIQQQIQITIDTIPKMYETKNPALIDTIIDTERPYMKTTMRQRYDTYQQRTQTMPRGVVDGIERQDDTYVLAHIRYPSVAAANWWLFRAQDGVWRLSEPASDAQTPVLTTTTDHAYLQFDVASTRFADAFTHLATIAIQELDPIISLQGTERITITVQSSSQLLSAGHAFAIGGYQDDIHTIYLLNPFTYVASAFPNDDWQSEYIRLIKHEYVHYLIAKKFDISMKEAPLWMIEGISQYISNPDTKERMQLLKQENGIIPIVPEPHVSQTLATWSWKADPLTGYLLSGTAARYCIETYGGIDAFLRFTQAAQHHGYRESLDAIYHVSPAQFNQQWFAWVDKTFS